MDDIITNTPDFNITSMMNWFIGVVYKLHTRILSLNDKYEASLSDKQLHFFVIGIFGLILLLLFFFVFRWLEKHKLTIISSWLTTFIILVAVSFAIEIAQGISNTGDMDFKDIVAGLAGYFAFSGALLTVFLIISLIRKLIKNKDGQ